jgi:hypothetical protein
MKLPLHRPTLSSHRGAGNEGRPCDTSWASDLVSKLMQERHCRLFDTSVQLNGGRNKGVAARLPSRIRCPLLMIPQGRGRSC